MQSDTIGIGIRVSAHMGHMTIAHLAFSVAASCFVE